MIVVPADSRLESAPDRMAHTSRLLHNVRKHRLHLKEVPVKVRYTDYSLAKGQGALQAVHILVDSLFRAC
jgi:hypothetical protein